MNYMGFADEKLKDKGYFLIELKTKKSSNRKILKFINCVQGEKNKELRIVL